MMASLKAKSASLDDSFFPALGYLVGLKSGNALPILTGLEDYDPSFEDLKAFSAAFGTSGSSAMFHIAGVTPEAQRLDDAVIKDTSLMDTVVLSEKDLIDAWTALDSGRSDGDIVELVALGNPHLSLEECKSLAGICCDSPGGKKHPDIRIAATMGRSVHSEASLAGYINTLEDFGVEFITDTCWCMLTEPVVPVKSTSILTNSAKYAHYAPGLVRKKVRYHNMKGCIETARTGKVPPPPNWVAFHSYSTIANATVQSTYTHASQTPYTRLGAGRLARALRTAARFWTR